MQVDNGFSDPFVLFDVVNPNLARALFVKFREHTVATQGGRNNYAFRLWNEVFNTQMHTERISNQVIGLGGSISPQELERIFPTITRDNGGHPNNPLYVQPEEGDQ